MRPYVLGISAGVMMLAASGEMQAQDDPFPAITQKWQSALNTTNPDPNAIAAFYSDNNAVGVYSEGIFVGKSAIANDLVTQVTKNGWANIKITYQKDTNNGVWAWSYGCFGATVGGQPVNGYWSVVWVIAGTSWNMQQQTTTVAQPPVSNLCPST